MVEIIKRRLVVSETAGAFLFSFVTPG